METKWVKDINAGSGSSLPPEDITDNGNSGGNVIDMTPET